MGFLQRENYRRTNLSGRFSPRPEGSGLVRRYALEGGIDYFTTADQGFVETRERTLDFTTEFHNSDRFEVNLTNSYELLQEPFRISKDVVLPVGGYGFTAGTVSYTLGGQRTASGGLAFTAGSLWSGDIRTLEYRQGRINVSNQFSVEPTISFNDIDLPEGEFTTTLVSTRFNFAFNPRMFFSGWCSTTRATTAGATTCGCGGNTARGASCSWYTPRSATSTRCGRGGSTGCATAASSSSSTGCSGCSGCAAPQGCMWKGTASMKAAVPKARTAGLGRRGAGRRGPR